MRTVIIAGVLSLATLALGLAPPPPPMPVNAETDKVPRCPITMSEVMAAAGKDECMTTSGHDYTGSSVQRKCDDLERTLHCALDALKAANSSLVCDYVGVVHVLDTCWSPANSLQRLFHISPLECMRWRDTQAHNPCAMVRCDEDAGMSCVVLPVMIPGMEEPTDVAVCKELSACEKVEDMGCSEKCHKHARDADSGCHTCECECPARECPRHCIEGFKEGADGCPTCECKDAMIMPRCPVGEPMCEFKCDHYAIDMLGCNTCQCQCEPLCCDEPCPAGQVNAWDASGCRTCSCVAEASTGDLGQMCPDPACPQDCGIEFYTDVDGCRKCRCDASTPCDDTDDFMCDAPCRKEPGFTTCECVCPGGEGVEPGPDTMCSGAQCPQDCGAEYYWSEEMGCSLCRCDGKDACHSTELMMCDAPCYKVPRMTTCDCVCPESTYPPPTTTSEPCFTATCMGGCRSVPLGNGCYGCDCTTTTPYTPTMTTECPAVTCQTGCRYITDTYGCTACDCETTTATTPACTMATCRPGCREVPGENGCPICDCPVDPEDPCRDHECPEGCTAEQDSFWCKCECPTTTPHPCTMEDMMCPLDCETEHYRDPRTGCEMCRCAAVGIDRCPPLEDCPLHCQKYETDDVGCIRCACDYDLTYPETCPMFKCAGNCDHGRVIDGDGCRTCECKPHPCDTITCPGDMECNMCYSQLYCERTMGVHAPCGRCYDDDMSTPTPTPGYPTCEDVECEEGQECQMEEVMCVMAPCPPLPTCGARQPPTTTSKPSCPEIMCMMWCEFGNVLDDQGCNMCKCKPDPCQGARCPGGKQCQLAEAPICGPGQTCPRVARCMAMEGVCQQPKEIGPCRALMLKYYYNSETYTCQEFNYGGCQGNDNNFESMAACVDMCGAVDPLVATTTTPEPPTTTTEDGCGEVMCMMFCEFGFEQDERGCDMCSCRPDPCEAMRCPAGQMCELTEGEQCPATGPCPRVPTCVADGPVCEKPKVVGPCRATHRRWFFSESGACQMFFYGGCQGNDNNFESEEECQEMCGGEVDPTTTQRPLLGACEDDQKRCSYGACYDAHKHCNGENDCFDGSDEQGCDPAPPTDLPSPTPPECGPVCMMFCEHGMVKDKKGCPTCKCNPDPCRAKGLRCSENERCEDGMCVTNVDPDHDVCEDPPKSGRCRAYFPSWYYDPEDEECKEFVYGGCGGNGNRFKTEAECRAKCPMDDESGEVTVRPQEGDLVCPAVPGGTMGICMEGCDQEDPESCPEGQLCCSNGCGHACKPGVPATAQPPTTTKTVCRECSYDACDGQTCALHGGAVCKHTCNCEYVFVDPGTNKVVDCSAPQPLCERQRAEAKATGERAPQCAETGQFSWDQCQDGWCWCVDDMGHERSGTRVELKGTFDIQLFCDPFKTTGVEFMLRFDEDYDQLLPNEAAKMKFEAALERKLMLDYGVEEGQINDVSVSRGSIVTEFTLVEGSRGGDLASRASYIEQQAKNGEFELEYEGRTLKPETTETDYEGKVQNGGGGNTHNVPAPASSGSGLSITIVMVIAIAAFVVVALVVGLVVLVMTRRQYSGQAQFSSRDNFTVPVENPGYAKHSPPPTYSSITAIRLTDENEVKVDLPLDDDVVGELPEMRETAPPGDQAKRYSVDC